MSQVPAPMTQVHAVQTNTSALCNVIIAPHHEELNNGGAQPDCNFFMILPRLEC